MTEEALFAAALEQHAPAQRRAFLDQACAGDETLRRRMEALLESHEGSSQFLRSPALKQMADSNPDCAALGPETPPAGAAADAPTELAPTDPDPVLRLLEPARRPGSLGRLSHYEVLEVLGRGGFGTVLKVFDEKLHRVVAIKVLAPALAASSVARQRFLREARAAAAVRHDHVISIHAVDEAPIPHLVMEFIDGPTLQQKLDRTGALPLKEILRVGLQIAAGLAAAHKQGLIHRDIKPSNILLENGVERVKISDFGLARAMDDASLTQSGLIAGTPQYMSPEQAEGRHLDRTSDLFSLGSVLYAMCSGRAPFRAESTLAVLRRVCDDTPRSIRECNSDIPEWLAAIITKLHAKKPAERIQSARELADLLADHLAELQAGGAIAPGPVPPENENAAPSAASRKTHASRRFSSSAGLLAGLSLLGILGALAIWFFLARPWQDSGNDGPPGNGLLEPHKVARGPAPPDTLLVKKTHDGPGTIATRPIGILVKDPFRHKEHGANAEVAGVTYSPDGKFVASANARFDHQAGAFTSWEVKLWDADTGAAVREFPDHANAVHAIAFSPDGQRLATGCRDGTVKAWELATGKELLNLKGHAARVRSVAFSPDGKGIAAGSSSDGKVILWDAADGTEKFAFDKQAGGVLHVAFSRDGSLLASVGEVGDGSVRVLETGAGAEIARLTANTDRPRAAVFNHDGKRVLIAGHHAVAQVWDVATQQLAFELKGHGSWIVGADRSKDGAYFATASMDSTACLWDAATGQLIRSFPGHSLGAVCVAFHPDGKTLACGDGAGQVHIWDVTTGKQLIP